MIGVLEKPASNTVLRGRRDRPHVVIAGAGPAGVEAALRLRRLAGQSVRITIVAPEPGFLELPPAAAAPFGLNVPGAPRLTDWLAPVVLRRGTVRSVSCDERKIQLHDGGTVGYDMLLIAVGGRQRSPFRRAITYGTPGSEERMHGLVQDIEAGYVKRVAFVVPPGCSWPLPLHELALMTAERAYDMCADVDLTLVTPEPRVLDILGDAISDDVSARLGVAGVSVRTNAHAVTFSSRSLELRPAGEWLDVDRVVTLPLLGGPRLEGLPHDPAGFIPIDRHGRVAGAPGVYAAGDATTYAIKQGGIACQQADAAAEGIVADAGLEGETQPFEPVLRGVLLTARGGRVFDLSLRDPDGPWAQRAERTWSKFAGPELASVLGGPRRRP